MDTLLEQVRRAEVRGAPAPLGGGPVALLRFMRAHRMLTFGYARLVARWCLTSAPISVDFPAPGGPVKPTTAAAPVCG